MRLSQWIICSLAGYGVSGAHTADDAMTRRYGPFKQWWCSICSAHVIHDANCDLCNSGHWVNVWVNSIGGWVYDLAPNTWRRWANREVS